MFLLQFFQGRLAARLKFRNERLRCRCSMMAGKRVEVVGYHISYGLTLGRFPLMTNRIRTWNKKFTVS